MSKPAATAVSRVCVSVGLSICVCLCVCVCACVRVWVRVCRGYVCEHDHMFTTEGVLRCSHRMCSLGVICLVPTGLSASHCLSKEQQLRLTILPLFPLTEGVFSTERVLH